jgi:hypothetical protein
VNWSAVLVALEPPEVMTVTSTVLVPPGAVALMVVELVTVNVAAVPPKFTAFTPVKLVPVTVTDVPLNPEVGLTPVTVGAGMYV